MSGPDDIISQHLPIDGTGVDGLDGAYGGTDGASSDGTGGTPFRFEFDSLSQFDLIVTPDPDTLTPTTFEAVETAVWQKIGA